MEFKTLARLCDAWYKGARADIVFKYDGAAAVVDVGHSMPMSPESWKGVVSVVRSNPDARNAFASKSRFYSNPSWYHPDTFGTLPRYNYGLTVVDDVTLKLHNDGKLDDGN